MKLLVHTCFLFGIIYVVLGQEAIKYPGENNEKSCHDENMILVQESEDSSKLVCDCKPKFLYHRDSDSCHEAYRRGPCPAEHNLVLPAEEFSAKCEKNPCLEDGLVHYKGSCTRFGHNEESCEDNKDLLTVNEDSFELECVQSMIPVSFFSRNKNVNDCPKGSRRIYSGKCKHIFQ